MPVHELGLDADGRPYFTMKRLAGITLAKQLADGAPVKPMLRAFVDICFAIQFAHERSYVHRDLKPANIMLGEYGEVYVLDSAAVIAYARASVVSHPWLSVAVGLVLAFAFSRVLGPFVLTPVAIAVAMLTMSADV